MMLLLPAIPRLHAAPETISPPFEPRIAIVVGSNVHAGGADALGALRYAERDAESMRDMLGAQDGFWDVRSLIGPKATRAAVLHEIDRASNVLAPGGTLLVYVAGHGLMGPEGDPNRYLVLADGDPTDLAATGLAVNTLKAALDQATGDGERVGIFDTCGAPLTVAANDRVPTVANRGLARFADTAIGAEVGSGELYLWASTIGGRAMEGTSLEHGAYTGFFLDGLAGAADDNDDDVVTAREAHIYASRQVSRLTFGVQVSDMEIRDAEGSYDPVLVHLPRPRYVPAAGACDVNGDGGIDKSDDRNGDGMVDCTLHSRLTDRDGVDVSRSRLVPGRWTVDVWKELVDDHGAVERKESVIAGRGVSVTRRTVVDARDLGEHAPDGPRSMTLLAATVTVRPALMHGDCLGPWITPGTSAWWLPRGRSAWGPALGVGLGAWVYDACQGVSVPAQVLGQAAIGAGWWLATPGSQGGLHLIAEDLSHWRQDDPFQTAPDFNPALGLGLRGGVSARGWTLGMEVAALRQWSWQGGHLEPYGVVPKATLTLGRLVW